MKARFFVLAAALLAAAPASAQVSGVSFSVGPQVSTLGAGVGASVRMARLVGVSAEYNLVPMKNTERYGFDNNLLIEPALQGGLFLVTLHPTGGKFTIAGGVQAGGAAADVTLALAPASGATLNIGGTEYPASEVGTLAGSFQYGSSVQPTGLIGWTGKGFNFAVGASLATPELELSVSGPLGNDAAFQADLQKEIDDFDESAGKVPVFPYVRLGWQFGF